MYRPTVSFVLSLLAVVVLASCEPIPVPTPGQGLVGQDTCGAGAFVPLVGEPESVLAGMSLNSQTRIIHPGEAVTADYSATRLNIEINKSGRIERIVCG